MAGRANAADEQAEMLRQIAELRADVERLTATLGATAQGRATGLLDQLQDLGGAAEAAVKDRVAGAEAVLEQASDYARRKPLQALGLALGAGMVFGTLFGRR